MFARSLAIVAAGTLAIAPVPALAQANTTPTADVPIQQEQSGSDLLVMLGALIAAALVVVLATQLGGGDAPASP